MELSLLQMMRKNWPKPIGKQSDAPVTTDLFLAADIYGRSLFWRYLQQQRHSTPMPSEEYSTEGTDKSTLEESTNWTATSGTTEGKWFKMTEYEGFAVQ